MDYSKIKLFDNINGESCHLMMECFDARHRTFKRGQIVYDFSGGENSIVIITKGKAFMIREDIDGMKDILEHIEENGIFGDMLNFSKITKDNIYVLCEEDCECIFIRYDQITKRCVNACGHHTQLIENLFDLMLNKALMLSERVEVLSRRSIRSKLMCYFIILAREKNVANLPFSITALAEYLCVDRSAMVRELGNMKKEGIIELDKREIKIC